MPRYWLETLGCPKNQVDSDKLVGVLDGRGHLRTDDPSQSDLLVINTCAFVEAAREESIEAILAAANQRKAGARLVVTGCLAQRYGEELAEAIPEVDLVAPFGVDPEAEVDQGSVPVRFLQRPSMDLLELPRSPATEPWAYVKVAEGCDRKCGFCAIPSFRGRQRSRTATAVLEEISALGVSEAVLVAQDIASWGRDALRGSSPSADPDFGMRLAGLVRSAAQAVPWVRLLYLYPSSVSDALVDAICSTGVPYFDLSLQHASPPLLSAMRRWGGAEKFFSLISKIRDREPAAALRSSFVIGYPGETEEDHDRLLEFLKGAQLDWAGFFPFSPEEGTYAASLPGAPPEGLVLERIAECSQLQESITAAKRRALVGREVEVLVVRPGRGRSYREAPEIDGIIEVPKHLSVGSFHRLVVTDAVGPDLSATELEMAFR